MTISPAWKSHLLPAMLFPALFLLTIFKLIDTDLWLHMKAGQVITETGGFIYNDIFSYTAAGREWLYHEWLFGVVSYHLYSLLGVNGLIIGKAVLLTLAFIIIYKTMRLRDVNPWLASFILSIGVLAARFRFTERPHIFKFLFVAAFIYILDLHRLKGRNRLWFLPVIQLLWTNIHGSFILGPAIIGIYLFSEAFTGKRQELKGLAAILILTSLTTLINPYGLKLLSFSLGFGEKQVLASITEWKPSQLKDFYGAFGMLLVAGLASFSLKYKRTELVDLLLFGLFAYLSFKAIRFTALFSLATAPIIAGNIQYLDIRATRRIAPMVLIVLTIVGMLTFHEIRRNPILVFGLGSGQAFPEKAAAFVKKNNIRGNMYNSYVFGGHLIWSLYPERKVFVDGRAEVYDKEFQESFISGASPNKWAEAVNRYDINYAVVAYSAGNLDPIGKWIGKDANWVLIYWDNAARVYVRSTSVNQDVISLYGHQVLTSPMEFNYNSLKEALAKGLDKRLESELKKDIESNPENKTALYWLGTLYYETDRKEEALNTWTEAARIKPDATTFSSIGNIYAEKRLHKKAIEYYKKAVETDKRFVTGWYNLGNTYEAVNQNQEAVTAYRKFIKYAGPEYANEVRLLKEKGIE